MKMLNIGCGSTFHPDWINIDVEPSTPSVLRLDASRGLPFPDNTFDVCYSSHVLEHLQHGDAERFLCEIHRILKPGGTVRLAVPDLENIVRAYLAALERAVEREGNGDADYDWMLLELLDQMVRPFSGGEMGDYLKNPALRNREFILSRIGREAENIWELAAHAKHRSFIEILRSKSWSWFFRWGRIFVAKKLVALVAGRTTEKWFAEGIFRNSGEIHRWMYDRFSLRRALEKVGFAGVKECSAVESGVPGFVGYDLDAFGTTPRKPDSLYMEALKP